MKIMCSKLSLYNFILRIGYTLCEFVEACGVAWYIIYQFSVIRLNNELSFYIICYYMFLLGNKIKSFFNGKVQFNKIDFFF